MVYRKRNAAHDQFALEAKIRERQAVQRVLETYTVDGVFPRNRNPRSVEARRRIIRDLYKKCGLTQGRIAEALGVSQSRVSQIIKEGEE